MADRVRITDVSPRDGLQNEPGVIPTPEKVRLIELLCGTGVDEIEVTSFVSPKWVPQLADAQEVLAGIASLALYDHSAVYSALVPNEQGMQAACRHNPLLEKVAVFTAASESFAKKNINASIAESIDRFAPVVELGHGSCAVAVPMSIRAYISCAIACPIEGPIAPEAVADVAARLAELGVDEIDLGDTIGAGTPSTVERMLKVVRSRLGGGWRAPDKLTLHLHDTFGRAAECVKAALDCGVRSFDGSVAGLGGCPYASTPGHRAPGNIATETLVKTIHAAGYETGVDLDKLAAAAEYAREIVTRSRAAAARKGVDRV